MDLLINEISMRKFEALNKNKSNQAEDNLGQFKIDAAKANNTKPA